KCSDLSSAFSAKSAVPTAVYKMKATGSRARGPMSRRAFIRNSTAAVSAGLLAKPALWGQRPGGGEPAGSRPNVLLLMADDCSTTLGRYGRGTSVTPHLDALARRGVRF